MIILGEGGGKCDYLNHLLRAIFSLKASENMHTYTQINTCIFDNYVDRSGNTQAKEESTKTWEALLL